MYNLLLVLSLMLISCGKNHEPKETVSPVETLRGKWSRYLAQSTQATDGYGFVGDKCDSLLWTSLGAIGGLPVDPGKAEKAPGLWERHPSWTCYPEESASTISKDMLHGVMLWAYVVGRRDVLERLHAYGEAHSWTMGEAVDEVTTISRVIMSVSQVVRLKKMLGMGVRGEGDGVGDLFTKPGFEGHLDVLGIYSDALVNGHVSPIGLAKLNAYCDRWPANALYCAIYHKYHDGDQSQAISILSDTSLFPDDRLPTSADRCEGYLWQRDPGSDWQPCPAEGKIHPGVDFDITMTVIAPH